MKPRRLFLFQAAATLALLASSTLTCAAPSLPPRGPRLLLKNLKQAEHRLGSFRRTAYRYRQRFTSIPSAGQQMALFQQWHRHDLSRHQMIEVGGIMVSVAEWALLSVWTAA